MWKKNKTILEPRRKYLRINGIKTLCNVPSSSEYYNYWYENVLADIRMWWRFKKLDVEISLFDIKNRRARKKYCRKGYHKLKPAFSSIKIWNKKKRAKSINVRYLKCVHCNYRFFSTMNDKTKYEKINSQTKEGFSAFLKSASCPKPKDSLGMVQKKKKEPSVRGSKKRVKK